MLDPLSRWQPYSATSRIVAAVLPLHRQMTPDPPPAIGIIEPERKHRQRKPSLAAALKQARKAGVSVKGATIEAGKVSLEFGEPEAAEAGDAWDKALGLKQ